mgnify:CR=1 FL=1
MYRAKELGRDQFQFYSPEMGDSVGQRLGLETRLREAIDKSEFQLHYQPQWQAASGQLVGLEALLRWQHPERGRIGPNLFIPVAEETGRNGMEELVGRGAPSITFRAGRNLGLQRQSPWEFRLLGYRPEPWRPEDTVLMVRMLGYLTLAQSQTEVERLLVEMVQAGLPLEKLEELFPGNLGGLDVDLLKKVRLGERIVPPDALWAIAAPRMMASNNWVVSGRKTASGKPILANDPHRGHAVPSLRYIAHLTAPGLDVIGARLDEAGAVRMARRLRGCKNPISRPWRR